jgi:hypothetical protein
MAQQSRLCTGAKRNSDTCPWETCEQMAKAALLIIEKLEITFQTVARKGGI